MKITLEPTTEIAEISPATPHTILKARVWKGTTDAGVPLYALIASVAVERSEDQSAFELELTEKKVTVEPRVFSARLVID